MVEPPPPPPLDGEFEKRGCSIALFRAVRDLAVERDGAPGAWSIGAVSALLVGNHEIMKAGNRWEGRADPAMTLTHDGQSSLIELLHSRHRSAADKHPLLNVCYEGSVALANVFVSFAYAADFLELVDALECYLETQPEGAAETTFFWFDLFVNNQWVAADKSFEWWATTFRTAIQDIGKTVLVLLPWHAPIPLTRVWCLYEIYCSANLAVALSRKQTAAFQRQLRDDFENIQAALAKIDLEQATSYLPEDKDRIFAVVRALDVEGGGFHSFNKRILQMLREWIVGAALQLVEGRQARERVPEPHKDSIDDMRRVAILLENQGRLEEAAVYFRQAMHKCEAELGPLDHTTLQAIHSCGINLRMQGQFDEAKELYQRALKGNELVEGLEAPQTLNTVHNLAELHREQLDYDEARVLYFRALRGREEHLGLSHPDTCSTCNSYATMLRMEGKLDESKIYYERALNGRRESLGADHPQTMTSASAYAALLEDLGQWAEAEALFLPSMRSMEVQLGPDHINFLRAVGRYSLLLLDMGRFAEARQVLEKAIAGSNGNPFSETLIKLLEQVPTCEDAPGTLLKPKRQPDLRAAAYDEMMRMGIVKKHEGQLDEAKVLYRRVLKGREKHLGETHMSTLLVVKHLAELTHRMGHLVEARALYERVLAGLDSGHRAHDALISSTRWGLAALVKDEAKKEDASASHASDKEDASAPTPSGDEEDAYAPTPSGDKEDASAPTPASVVGEKMNLDEFDEMMRVGIVKKNEGKLEEAKVLISRALRDKEAHLGESHPSTLHAIHTLGVVLDLMEQGEAARAHFERALAGWSATAGMGPGHSDSLSAAANLARVLHKLGRAEEAMIHLVHVLQGREQHPLLGEEHEDTLDTAHSLGLLLLDEGNWHEAEALFVRTIAGREKHPGMGPKHPLTLEALMSLGVLRWKTDRREEGKRMLERVLQMREEHQGGAHIDTLQLLNFLAALHAQEGSVAKARELWERAKRGYEQTTGPRHPDLLNIVGNLARLSPTSSPSFDVDDDDFSDKVKVANLLLQQDRLQEAKGLFEKVLEERAKHYGPSHLLTLAVSSDLGTCMMKLGDWKQAEVLLMGALAGQKAQLGPNHPTTCVTACNLAGLYKERGPQYWERARDIYEHSIDGVHRHVGNDHFILKMINNYANLLKDMGPAHWEKARALYERAIKSREESPEYGPRHPLSLTTKHNFGALLYKQRKFSEARAVFQEVLKGQEEQLGPAHQATLMTLDSLASVVSDMGELDAAQAMYERALASYEVQQGPLHVATLRTVHNLGALCCQQRRFAESVPLFERALEGRLAVMGPQHPDTIMTADAIKAVRQLMVMFTGQTRSTMVNNMSGDGELTWVCSGCTFENHIDLDACEMCETKR